MFQLIRNYILRVSQHPGSISLGRWRLRHQEKDLHLFYNQIPDPGYPNDYVRQYPSLDNPQNKSIGNMEVVKVSV